MATEYRGEHDDCEVTVLHLHPGEPPKTEVWVLDCYMNEVGWDGQHELYYFSSEADANAVGKAASERVRRRVAAHRGDQRLDWDVYKLASAQPPLRVDEAKAIGRSYADQWLEAEW